MADPVEDTQSEKLRKKIVAALEEILVLHVTTAVGHVTVSNADDSGAVTTVKLEDANPKVANTVVNTLLGDGTTIYTPDFIADTALIAAHAEAVQAAHLVRKETLDMLKTLLSDFRDALAPKTAPGA